MASGFRGIVDFVGYSSGRPIVTGTGTLLAQAADITGAGVSLSTGDGVLLAQSSLVVGSGVSSSVGTGVLVVGSSVVTGDNVLATPHSRLSLSMGLGV